MIGRICKYWTYGILVALNLPILIVVVVSFTPTRYMTFPPPGFSLRWYESFFSSANWVNAAFNSFVVATGAVLIAVPVGIAAAFVFVRGRFAARRELGLLALTPLIVPNIVAAVAMYFFFAKMGLIGSKLSLVLAHATLVVPLVIISVTAVLVNLDSDLEAAASNLGANRTRTFLHVTFPIIRPAVLAASLFAFLMSFDELTVSLFLSGVESQTLPVRLWSAMRDELSPTVAAVSTLLILMSVAIVVFTQVIQWWGERRIRK